MMEWPLGYVISLFGPTPGSILPRQSDRWMAAESSETPKNKLQFGLAEGGYSI